VNWPRENLWGGAIAGHCTQAMAGVLLREAMRSAIHHGLKVVLQVHDELVVECKESEADATAQKLRSIMLNAGEWADGLPLDCSIELARRYG
jgi:DNA polymerase I-like protein with 3'-5' exonuclease and polymerase domains